MTKKTHIGIRAKIVQMAARPQGVSPLELVPQWSRVQAFDNALQAQLAGQVIVIGKRLDKRLFTAQADADRYAEELQRIRIQREKARRERDKERGKQKRAELRKAKPPKPAVRIEITSKRKQAKDAPVAIKHYGKAPWGPDDPADYSRAKVTVCPSPAAFGLAARINGFK